MQIFFLENRFALCSKYQGSKFSTKRIERNSKNQIGKKFLKNSHPDKNVQNARYEVRFALYDGESVRFGSKLENVHWVRGNVLDSLNICALLQVAGHFCTKKENEKSRIPDKQFVRCV